MITWRELMQFLRELPLLNLVLVCLVFVAPMVLLWFLAPHLENLQQSLGAPPRNEFRFWLFIPYPYPFTWRAWAGIAIVVVPPLLLLALWMRAQRAPREIP